MTPASLPRTKEEARRLSLRIWPDPVLSCPCEDVLPEEEPFLVLLVDQMRFLMDLNRGVGIAAPQLGVLKNVFLISAKVRAGEHLFVNPEIQLLGASESPREGCLSVPGRNLNIRRRTLCRVYSRGSSTLLMGLAAQVAQHEYEHLQGVIQVAG